MGQELDIYGDLLILFLVLHSVPSMGKYENLLHSFRGTISDRRNSHALHSPLYCNIITGIILIDCAGSRRLEGLDEALTYGTNWRFYFWGGIMH